MEEAIGEQEEDELEVQWRCPMGSMYGEICESDTCKDLDRCGDGDTSVTDSTTTLENPEAGGKVMRANFIQFGYIAKFIESSKMVVQSLN